MLKTLCFFTFFILGRHFEILKVSFCTVWANSKLRKLYFVQAKRSFFSHAGKSSLEIVIQLVMEALCLHWKLPAHFQRFSLVPPWDLFFWKSDQLPFFQNFHCGVKLLGACDNKAVVELHSFFLTNSCRLCETSVNMRKRSNMFHQHNIKPLFAYVNNMRPTPPHPTPPAYLAQHRGIQSQKKDSLSGAASQPIAKNN